MIDRSPVQALRPSQTTFIHLQAAAGPRPTEPTAFPSLHSPRRDGGDRKYEEMALGMPRAFSQFGARVARQGRSRSGQHPIAAIKKWIGLKGSRLDILAAPPPTHFARSTTTV